MWRSVLVSLAGVVLAGNLHAAQHKERPPSDTPKHTQVIITKIDAKSGEITVKYTDAAGKERHKTFRLTRDVKILDETGRVVTLDVFESGSDATDPGGGRAAEGTSSSRAGTSGSATVGCGQNAHRNDRLRGRLLIAV